MGTAIGTKCAPPYPCIFIDKVEIDFLESRKPKSMVWFRYANDLFFLDSWREQFFKELSRTHSNFNFTHKSSEEKISFLNLSVILSNGELYTDLHMEPTDHHQYLEYISSHQDYPKK